MVPMCYRHSLVSNYQLRMVAKYGREYIVYVVVFLFH